MMKVLKNTLLIFGLFIFVNITSSMTVNAETNQNYTYMILEDLTVSITDYTGEDVNLIIPKMLDGKIVSSIGNYAFSGDTFLQTVKMPDTVTAIGGGAFYGCNNLKSIELSDTIISIGAQAFFECSDLESVKLPETLIKIANSAFLNCTSIEQLEIPNSVEEIGMGALKGTSLKKLKVPFVGESRETIFGPASVFGWIFGCWDYESTFSRPNYRPSTNTDQACRLEDGASWSHSYYIPATLENVEITDAKIIQGAAFHNCKNLTRIAINEGVDLIKESAFAVCSRLKNIELPNGVRSIEKRAFYNCAKLESVVVGTGTEILGEEAFGECPQIKEVYLPDSLNNIGKNLLIYSNKKACLYANEGTKVIQYAADNKIIYSSVRSIQILNEDIVLKKGDKQRLNVLVTLLNGKNKENAEIVWDSSDKTIATVENSEIMINGPGTAVLTASYGNRSDKIMVTIFYPLENIEFAQTIYTIQLGQSMSIPLNIIPQNTTDDVSLIWSSDDDSVATVNKNGVVTAKNIGTCIIKVAIPEKGMERACKLEVVNEKVAYNQEDLIKIASSGEKITCVLNDDIILDDNMINVKYGTELTLDLNGHVVEGAGTSAITNNGILHIKDNRGNGLIKMHGTVRMKNYSGICNNAGAVLTVDAGTIQTEYNCAGSLNLAIVSGIYNYGILYLNGGDIVVSSRISGDTAMQQVFGVFNNENGTFFMSGGNIKLSTQANVTSIDAEIRTVAYGIINQTDHQIKITGGTIDVKHDITSNAKENIALIAGVANNSSSGSISVEDGIIKSQLVGKANYVSGGLSGICNLANGTVYFDGGDINVVSDISKNISVAGIINDSTGNIIVGKNSNASNIRPRINTISNTQLDTGIIAGGGKLSVQHGNIKGSIGIQSEKDVIIGKNDASIKPDDLYIEGSIYIFVVDGKVVLYDGTFSGGFDLESQANLIYVPKGYTIDGIKGNRLINATLKPIHYTITYNLNGGKNHTGNPRTYNVTNKKIMLSEPTKKGYKFIGWYTNQQYTNRINAVTGDLCKDIVLYAKWEKIGIGMTLNDPSQNCQVRVTNNDAKNSTVEYLRPIDKSIKIIEVPTTVIIAGIEYKVTSIANNAFKNNKHVTKIIIGTNVKSIGTNAFRGCKKLKTVTIGKNVTEIGDKVFYKCLNLSKIKIPNKVTKIGKQAFYGCKRLKSINIKTSKLTDAKVGSKAFKGIHTKAKVKVPKNKCKDYKTLLSKKGIGKKVTVKK